MTHNLDHTTDAASVSAAINGLRRDATFIWNAVIVVVFVGFAGLAIGSALLDLISIR